MLLRPDRTDLRLIGLATGRVLLGVGVTMLVPAALALVLGEHNEVAGFVIGACLAILPGLAAEHLLATRAEAQWHHGMVVAALSWLLAAFFAAVPLYLSGHYGGYVDAYFDAMSGFATAGLAVINDLDHLSDSVNLWRHLLQFMGGQGLVLIMLSFFAGSGGAVGMYAGEAREDKIMPNVVRTSRFIWRVALTWLLVGSSALCIALLAAGLTLDRAVLHAVTLFMAAFDTGGFAPTSASIGLYHSPTVELVIGVLMVAGGLSFALHYQLWQRRTDALLQTTEVRAFALSMLVLFAITTVGLLRFGTYESFEALLRRGLFHVVSAHTGTGFNSVPGRLFVTGWGTLAPAAIVAAMGLGAMAGSTAGGIKMIRVVLAVLVLRSRVTTLVLPADAASVETYRSGGVKIVRERVARAALVVLLLFLALYLLGALAGMFYGYAFDQAMFESTSAAAAVGLSVGLVSPGAPTPLKIVYILQMWIGRLEFVAVFALVGFCWALVRGRT